MREIFDAELNNIIGQTLGVIVTVIAIIVMQLKGRKQILWASVIVNIIGGLNVFFVDDLHFSSAIMMNVVAIIQIFAELVHERRKTAVSLPENIIFLVMYVISGVVVCRSPIDVFAIVAAVFYMAAMTQKKEQRIRILLLGNMSSWTIYHLYLGNAGVMAQFAGIISALIGLYRYRKTKKKENENVSG